MSRGLVIRKAQLTDLERIEGPNEDFRQGWSRKLLLAELDGERRTMLIAQLESRHAGHGIAWEVAGEVHILDVYVEPWARRQGIAKALVLELIESCGGGLSLLEVHESNAAAIALYRSMGFVEAGRRPRYYEDHCDAVLMNRDSDLHSP